MLKPKQQQQQQRGLLDVLSPQNVRSSMSNPMTQLGLNILAGSSNGDFGGGLQQGLLAIDRQQQQEIENQDRGLKRQLVLEQIAQMRKGPPGPAPTAAMRHYDFAKQQGFDGSFMDYQQSLKQAGRPTTNIQMPASENAYQKKRGETIANSVNAMENQTSAARQVLQSYTQIGHLLNADGVYSGVGGEPIAWIKKAGKTLFGLDIEGVADSTALHKVRSSALGKIREMAGDQRMTDADRKFYIETMPGLSDDAEGAQLAIEIMQQQAQALMRKEAKWHEISAANPRDTTLAWRKFRDWERQQSIWSPELMQRARENAKKKAVQRSPGAGMGSIRHKYGLE